MNSLEALTSFLGWCTLINIGFLAFSTLMIKVAMDSISKIHSGMFSVPQSELPMLYLQYLSLYKILIMVFNVVPYLALRIIL